MQQSLLESELSMLIPLSILITLCTHCKMKEAYKIKQERHFHLKIPLLLKAFHAYLLHHLTANSLGENFLCPGTSWPFSFVILTDRVAWCIVDQIFQILVMFPLSSAILSTLSPWKIETMPISPHVGHKKRKCNKIGLKLNVW